MTLTVRSLQLSCRYEIVDVEGKPHVRVSYMGKKKVGGRFTLRNKHIIFAPPFSFLCRK